MTSTETVRTKTMSSSYRPRPRPADPQAGAADGLNSAISASTTPRIDTPPVSASGVLAPAMTVPGRSSAYRPRPGRGAAPAAGNATQGTAMVKSRSTLRTGVGADQKALAAKVLQMISMLPHPHPERLPPIYDPNHTYEPSTLTFVDYLAAHDVQLKAEKEKRLRDHAESGIGLGLDLDGRKRHKPDESQASGSGSSSPEHLRLRGESKDKWSREKWFKFREEIAQRAILDKRYADAAGRTSAARAEFMIKVSEDHLLSLLYFTDAVMLFLYSYWCSEQASGKTRPQDFVTSDRLREQVLHTWERETRKEDATDDEKTRAKGMVGLMHLVEAMVAQHLLQCQQVQLSRRRAELSTITASTPRSANMAAPVPLTIGRSPYSPSPPDPQRPSPSNVSSDVIPIDVFNLIGDIDNSATKAIDHLQTSRLYLSPKLLRAHFPRMFENTVASDMSDEALPAPGDMLGSGKSVDPDYTDHFAWPIELGMSAGIAHLAVFGRGMVKEYAEKAGYKWELKLE